MESSSIHSVKYNIRSQWNLKVKYIPPSEVYFMTTISVARETRDLKTIQSSTHRLKDIPELSFSLELVNRSNLHIWVKGDSRLSFQL